MGQRVTLDASTGLTAYQASPAGTPTAGVVMIQEIGPFGQAMRDAADRMAGWGYTVLAPELASTGSMATCMARAFADLRRGTGPTFDMVALARQTLRHELGDVPIVIAGFCLGGGYALVLSSRGEYAAAVANYGDLPKDLGDLERACPIVASYGGRDLAFAGKGRTLGERLDTTDVPHDVKVYPDAGHSFLNSVDEIPWYTMPIAKLVLRAGPEPSSAADAWERTRIFLEHHLNGEG